MNKYPLDSQGVQNIAQDFLVHDKSQREIIQKLSSLLSQAVSNIDAEGNVPFLQEVDEFLRSLHNRQIDFDTLRFDQENGHKLNEISPYSGNSITMNMFEEGKYNSIESGFGESMTEEELAIHFKEPLPKKKEGKAITNMTIEEINELEAAQNNSNDIYKISARVKNLAREGGAALTGTGESLCNTYVHVMKSFYDFASTIQDKETKIKLTELIRKHEVMPADFISAVTPTKSSGE